MPLSRNLIAEFVRFGVVGGVGFVVDGAILYVLVAWHMNPLLARAVSFPCALAATWLLNSAWTFRAYRDEGSRARQAAGYVAVQCGGMAVNYAVFAFALRLTGHSSLGSLVALAFGSAAGLVVNFAGSRMLVFGRGAPSPGLAGARE